MTIRLLDLVLVALPMLAAVAARRRRARIAAWAFFAFAASEFIAQMPVYGGVGPARLAIGAVATAVSVAATAVLLAAGGVWVCRRSLRARLAAAGLVVLLFGAWVGSAGRWHPRPRQGRASVEIRKSERTLTLRRAGTLPQTYHIALGHRPAGDKQVEGDQRTPEGEFIICAIGHAMFDPFLRLNYPTSEDAVRGRRAGLITWLDFLLILRANRRGRVPPQRTNLGGAIGIHGGGTRGDWTWGCIALDDAHVEALERAVDLGAPVSIRP